MFTWQSPAIIIVVYLFFGGDGWRKVKWRIWCNVALKGVILFGHW